MGLTCDAKTDLAILTMAGYLEARPRVGYFIRVKLGRLLSEAVKKIKVQDYQSRPVVIDKMFPYTMQFVRCFRGRWYIVRCRSDDSISWCCVSY